MERVKKILNEIHPESFVHHVGVTVDLVQDLTTLLLELEQPIKGIKLIRKLIMAVSKGQDGMSKISGLNTCFAKLCLKAKMY